MIEKMKNNQVSNMLNDLPAAQLSSSKTPAKTEPDASLQINSDSLIEQAKQAPADDADVIQKARELLLSGQLDYPENIRAAAESMIKFGV